MPESNDKSTPNDNKINNSSDINTQRYPMDNATHLEGENMDIDKEVKSKDISNENAIESEVKSKTKAKKKKREVKRGSKARTASAAMFFNDNKAIAGFGNPTRSVFTAVRELVENSLDAAERRGVTPDISVKLRRLNKSELIKLMGTNVVKTKDSKVDFIELSCKDNGVGVKRELVPQLFGTVLAGTKYGVQQTRGRFGLGSKMVLLHAMSTLDLPIQITTRPEGENVTYRVKLFIDLEKNQPIIADDIAFHEGDEEYFDDYGTEIKVSFTGNWTKARVYVREYFRQLAIITPYADIHVELPSDDNTGFDTYDYKRVVDEIPKQPEVVMIHPWGTDISTFRRKMANAEEDNLIDFLVNQFMGVSPAAAESFFEVVGVDPDKKPSELTSQEIRRIVHDGFNAALKEAQLIKRKRDRVFKFDEPKGDALSPLGSMRLRKGLEKELQPDFVEAVSRAPRAYQGHPFIIEAALGYGGGVNNAAMSKAVTSIDNKLIYRYANRIPLIFGAGNDLITSIVNSINWADYGLTRGSEPLAIAVSLVSTKIPFPETSKEYIDKVEEIGEEVRLALQQLGRKLKTFLGRKRRRQRERQRKSRFERYAPRTVNNLLLILEKEGLWDPITGISPARVIAALSSGKPRVNSSVIPYDMPVFQSPIWNRENIIAKLQKNNIYTTADFLRTKNSKLAKMLRIKSNRIDKIKRRTIDELDLQGELPPILVDIIIDPEVERRFHKKTEDVMELPRLNRALSRRWIRNAYDYIVSPLEKLYFVQGLREKLLENEKYLIVKGLTTTSINKELIDELSQFIREFNGSIQPSAIQETETEKIQEVKVQDKKNKKIEIDKDRIKISDLLPLFDDIKSNPIFKKRKINQLLEFLFEIAHPTVPLDEKQMATILIPYFIENLKHLAAEDPEILDINVNKSTQSWIDGFLRNAFNRRKIITVKDLINTEIDTLVEIGELQRTLYSKFITHLMENTDKIEIERLSTTNGEEKLKILKKAGINTFEDFIIKPTSKLIENKEIKKYVDLLLEESKDKIHEYLTMENKLGDIHDIKVISPELEAELEQNDIYTGIELAKSPVSIFSKKLQDQISEAKRQYCKYYNNLSPSTKKTMEKFGIINLEEIVLNPSYYLQQELEPEMHKELEDLISRFLYPIDFISDNLMRHTEILTDAGITTLGKFFIWPEEELSQITGITLGWINLIKESFNFNEIIDKCNSNKIPLDSISNVVDPYTTALLSELGFAYLQEVFIYRPGDILPYELERFSVLKEINQTLIGPLNILLDSINDTKLSRNVKPLISDLNNAKINTVLQLLKSSRQNIYSHVKSKKRRELLDELYADIASIEPTIIKRDSNLFKAIKLYNFYRDFKLPVINLSTITRRETELLKNEGIITVRQIYSTPNDFLADIMHIDKNKIAEKLSSAKLMSKGTPLYRVEGNKLLSIIEFEKDGIKYFQPDEIKDLVDAGFDTIESLFYMSDHRTFEVSGINWDTIAHLIKLLKSPLVLITWRKKIIQEISEDIIENDEVKTVTRQIETDYYETFDSEELEILSKNNITRVIDFITMDNNELSDLLEWDDETITNRKTSVILQEAGIDLSDLDIFRQYHVDHLKEMGIETIEDLYFATSEDTWDSSIIPYKSIQTIKDVLHLDLHNVEDELGSEMVDLLIENGVNTILKLFLTSEPILEQRTGLPAERFENLKFAIDLGILIEIYDKSIHFTPGLNFFQAQTLIDNGYTNILDILLKDSEKIASILSMDPDTFEEIKHNITRNTVIQAEEERGVVLKENSGFTRAEIKSIINSGIFKNNQFDTLQEILYQIDPMIFQGESYLLKKVNDLKTVCSLSLDLIGDLNPKDLKILSKYKIKTIGQVLMVGFEDLPDDKQVYDALNVVTRAVIELKPFMALGSLPAKSAIKDVLSIDEETLNENLLNVWKEQPHILHKRTMDNIRSILSIPASLTKIAKQLVIPNDEFNNDTIADVLLKYYPSETDYGAQFQAFFKTPGALITLLKEGSTPITLLDLDAPVLRQLLNNSINTIERLLMKDPKYLSSIVGNTQKFWREIKDIFDPDMFEARIEDIGIPIKNLHLSDELLKTLRSFEIQYLDEVIFYEDERLQDLIHFMYSSIIFMNGSPGEMLIAMDMGAETIVEALMALRRNNFNKDVITDIVVLAWNTFMNNRIPIPDHLKKEANKLKIYSMQDIAIESKRNLLSTSWNKYINQYLQSPLLLPLKPTELKTLVNVQLCNTVIEALTSPFIHGGVTEIREMAKQDKDLPILDISLSNTFIQKISKSLWNRFTESSITLQEILSARTISGNYKGVYSKYVDEARDHLQMPITRIYHKQHRLLYGTEYYKIISSMDDLIFALPLIYTNKPDDFNKIKEILYDDNTYVINDYPIPELIQKSAESAFNTPISGFLSLYLITSRSYGLLQRINTQPADNLRKYIYRSQYSTEAIPGIKQIEVWNLWQNSIYTISDLLMPEQVLSEASWISKKRMRELINSALSALNSEISDSIIDIETIKMSLNIIDGRQHKFSIATVMSNNTHPLITSLLDTLDRRVIDILKYPIVFTNITISIPDQLSLLKKGIFYISDLLFYPLSDLSDSIPDRYSRISLLSGLELNRVDIELDKIGIESSTETLLSLLHKVYNEDVETRIKFDVPLIYIRSLNTIIPQLKEIGIHTLLDLLTINPSHISQSTDLSTEQIIQIIHDINYNELFTRMVNIPLKLSNETELAKTSIEYLQNMGVTSLLDLPDIIPDTINRKDQFYLIALKSILNAPVEALIVIPEFDENILNICRANNMNKIKDVFRYHHLIENDNLDKILISMDSKALISYLNKHRPLSDFDQILKKEAKQLFNAGILTFKILENTQLDKITDLGLETEKYEKIIELLKLPSTNIVGIDGDNRTVGEFLTDPNNMNLEIPIPIKVKKNIPVSNYFEEFPDELSNIIQCSELFKNKDIIKFENILFTLNTHISHIPNIKKQWIQNLENAEIYRIWQYIDHDTESLANICKTSVSVQEEFKIKLNLSNITDKVSFTCLESDNDKLRYYKIFTIDDLLKPGITQNCMQIEDFKNLYTNYLNAYNREIWEIEKYWQMPQNTRVMIANKYESVVDLEYTNLEVKSEIIRSSINNELITPVELESWFNDVIVDKFHNMNINSIQKLLFKEYRQKEALDESKIIRSTIDRLSSLNIKHIKNAISNNITHISDLYLLDDSTLIKIFKTNRSKLNSVKDEIKSLSNDEYVPIKLGLFRDEIYNIILTIGMHSWLQIFGNYTPYELSRITGVTDKTISTYTESLNVPIWYLIPLREMGFDILNKLTSNGIYTLLDMVKLSRKLEDIIDRSILSTLMSNITRSAITTGSKHPRTKLSISSKIRIKDIPLFNEAGIIDPIDIFIHCYDDSKESIIADGIKDWLRLGDLSINYLEFPDKVLDEMLAHNITTIKDAIIATNAKLREFGATNNQIKIFRENMKRRKKIRTTPDSEKTPDKKEEKSSGKKSSEKKSTDKSKKTTKDKTTKDKTTKDKTTKDKTTKDKTVKDKTAKDKTVKDKTAKDKTTKDKTTKDKTTKVKTTKDKTTKSGKKKLDDKTKESSANDTETEKIDKKATSTPKKSKQGAKTGSKKSSRGVKQNKIDGSSKTPVKDTGKTKSTKTTKSSKKPANKSKTSTKSASKTGKKKSGSGKTTKKTGGSKKQGKKKSGGK